MTTQSPPKKRLPPSVNAILSTTRHQSDNSLITQSHLSHQLQTILDSILPDYFGFLPNSTVTVGRIHKGVASLFFSNRSLASQARFIMRPIIATLHQHYDLKAVRSFKIIAQSVSSDLASHRIRTVSRARMSTASQKLLVESALAEPDDDLADAVARLALHASQSSDH